MGTTNGRTTKSAPSRFRQMLKEPGIIMAPGAHDSLTAKIIQQAGSRPFT